MLCRGGDDILEENKAAHFLYEICASHHMIATEADEGKLDILATCDGVLKVDVTHLDAINRIEQVIIATRFSNTPIKKGDRLAGIRVIEKIAEKKVIEGIRQLAGGKPLLKLLPYLPKKVGIISMGNEAYQGRIIDAFGPVLHQKLSSYHATILGQVIVDDKVDELREAIEIFLNKGVELIICTGGISVSTDEIMPTAIKKTGAEIISCGAPVLPGAMFLLAYKDDIPIMGLPTCVMYTDTTVFDIILPRILTGEKIEKEDLVVLGHGGLCMECKPCIYPHCSFGKGLTSR